MRILTVSEVLQRGKGELVPSIQGKVTFVSDLFSGTNASGEWRLQNLGLSDGLTEIKIKITDREMIPADWKGRQVALLCKEGAKGLTGLRVEEDSYKGHTRKILKVTPSAIIQLAEGVTAPAPVSAAAIIAPVAPQPAAVVQSAQPSAATAPLPTVSREGALPIAPAAAPQPSPQPVPATLVPAPASPPVVAETPIRPTNAADQALAHWAALYLRCMDAADWVQTERRRTSKAELTTDAYQACVSSLFIQATRMGH
jgi:hypothetical protein